MKFIAFLILGFTLLISCKKEHTCACNYEGITAFEHTGKTTRKDAKEQCKQWEAKYAGMYGNATCTMK